MPTVAVDRRRPEGADEILDEPRVGDDDVEHVELTSATLRISATSWIASIDAVASAGSTSVVSPSLKLNAPTLVGHVVCVHALARRSRPRI